MDPSNPPPSAISKVVSTRPRSTKVASKPTSAKSKKRRPSNDSKETGDPENSRAAKRAKGLAGNPTRRRGRPKGSKNKNAAGPVYGPKRKRGRPQGSKNKKKAPTDSPKRPPGRPKGSKDTKKRTRRTARAIAGVRRVGHERVSSYPISIAELCARVTPPKFHIVEGIVYPAQFLPWIRPPTTACDLFVTWAAERVGSSQDVLHPNRYVSKTSFLPEVFRHGMSPRAKLWARYLKVFTKEVEEHNARWVDRALNAGIDPEPLLKILQIPQMTPYAVWMTFGPERTFRRSAWQSADKEIKDHIDNLISAHREDLAERLTDVVTRMAQHEGVEPVVPSKLKARTANFSSSGFAPEAKPVLERMALLCEPGTIGAESDTYLSFLNTDAIEFARRSGLCDIDTTDPWICAAQASINSQ